MRTKIPENAKLIQMKHSELKLVYNRLDRNYLKIDAHPGKKYR